MTHLIIAGHGMQKNNKFDPGAIGLIQKGEHRYVKEDLFPAMKKFLPKNHNVVFFDKYKVSNHGNIVSLAKQYKATEVTEIHYDAASATASGGHVIIYSGYSPDKMDLALRDVIDKMVGVRYSHKGHKGISGRNNLANVNRTANAGITYRLIELGFGTNKNDAKVLVEDVETYAKELVKAITGASNDKKPAKPAKKPASKPSKPKKVTGPYADIQNAINIEYDFNIAVDNIPGADTKKHLTKAYQTELNRQYNAGLVVDGIWGKRTRAATVNVYKGAKGKITWILQAMLVVHGYDIAVDGIYGNETEKALRAFQRANKLTVDAIAGKATFAKLFA